MKFLFIVFIPFALSNAFAQSNHYLINHLDSLVKVDQYIRGAHTNLNEEVKKLIDKNQWTINDIDSLHYYKLVKIFDNYGYPGYHLAGKDGSHDFWLLIQHQDNRPDFQQKVLEQMKVEVNANNASKNDYAYLIDRVLINTGKNQIYGTQMKLNDDSSSFVPKPTEAIEDLDYRRLEMGLPPIQYYIEAMNERFSDRLKSKDQ